MQTYYNTLLYGLNFRVLNHICIFPEHIKTYFISNNMISKIKRKLNTYRSIKHKGFNLPITRTNQGLNDNENYLNSSKEQIDHLVSLKLINETSNVLDFGSGQGRLVNGLKFANINIEEYVGVDTDANSIKWCNRFLNNYNMNLKFIHLPAFNARYNKSANGLLELPVKKNKFDLVFLNSVFSHMMTNDIAFYLKEFNRIINKNGAIYLTAFTEENVPNVSENPIDYLNETNKNGSLHRVRYEINYFNSLIKNSGLKIEHYLHQHIDWSKQSVFVLKK